MDNISNLNLKQLPKLPKLLAPYSTQFKQAFLRIYRLYWRTLLLTLPRYGVALFSGLLLGGMYYQV